MRILLLEDEAPAARRLAGLLRELRPEAELLGPCDTVADARRVLAEAESTGTPPDLLLADIELGDGLSFRLWDEAAVRVPVIFATAYDHYAARAFRVNSVDYLLKPIAREQLAEALDRFEAVGRAMHPVTEAPAGKSGPDPAAQLSPDVVAQLLRLADSVGTAEPTYRTRVLATRGQSLVPLPVAEVAHFYSEDRLSFAVDREGRRHSVGEPLARLAEELDPAVWFRINRAQLVRVDAVARAEPYLNHRLKLRLHPASPLDDVVARERVRAFRAWLGGGVG